MIRLMGGLYFPDINQITVNEYKPGEGVESHIDTLSGTYYCQSQNGLDLRTINTTSIANPQVAQMNHRRE